MLAIFRISLIIKIDRMLVGFSIFLAILDDDAIYAEFRTTNFFASLKNDEMFCPLFLLGITLRKAVYPVFYSSYVANLDKFGAVTTANMFQDK